MVPIPDAVVVTAQSSNPASLLQVGAQVFFSANDGTHGYELWRSDGTANGTAMVLDVWPGAQSSHPQMVGALGNAVLFRGFEGGQEGLWRSDGTAAGTWRLFAFPPRQSNANLYWVSVTPAGTRVFIRVQQRSQDPEDLWVSEGQEDDAQRIGAFDFGSIPPPLGVGGKLYFVAADAVLGSQFWVSDGTLLGTHMVQRLAECPANAACGPRPISFGRIGSQVYLGTEDQLWKTDGTPQGTVPVLTTPSSYFAASSDTVGYFLSSGSLWKTNGTGAGTTLAGSIPASGFAHARMLSDQRLGYIIYTYDNAQVWTSDGTPAGTAMVGVFQPSPSAIVAAVGTKILLSGKSVADTELWLADPGTGSVALLKDIDARVTTSVASSSPGEGAVLGPAALFAATDVRGRELWRSDGTAAGTQLVANIAPETAGGFVSGTVRDALTSAPAAGAIVRLCTTLCEQPQVLADAAGRYRFEGVVPGMYTVVVNSAPHLTQMYGGVNCSPSCELSSGTKITVAGGFETQGIDFSLARGGTISGSVIRASTGLGTYAEIYVRNSGGVIVDHQYLAQNGTYRSRGLPTGNYYVQTDQGRFGTISTVDQVFRGVNCLPNAECNWAGGELVPVTAGQDTTGINFALRSYGRITGTIRDVSGQGLQASVTFQPAESYANSVSVVSGTDGAYTSPFLAPGTYRVTASLEGYPLTAYPNMACATVQCVEASPPIAVTIDGNASGTDVVMTPTTTRLTGTVRSANGTLLKDIHVTLVKQDGSYSGSSTFTKADGSFSIIGRAAGTYYLKAKDDLHPKIDCPDLPCNVAGGTPVILTNGQSTTVDMEIRDRLTTISGRVTEAGTNTSLYARIGLYDAAKSRINPYELSNSLTPEYTLRVLSRSTSFYISADTERHHHIAYPAGRVLNDVLPATATPLAAGGTHAGINITLPRYGSIRGKVYDAYTGGEPRNAILVKFTSTTDPARSGSVFADQLGGFFWERAEGSYYISADYVHSQYLGQVYPDRDCNGDCIPSTGDVVVVPNAGEVTGIDFHLHPKVATGKIAGRVVDDLTGLGIPNVSIYAVTSSGGNLTVQTDAQGHYTLTRDGLGTGTYKLYAYPPPPYYLSIYGGAHCSDYSICNLTSGSAVPVTAPNTTPGINFRLIRLGLTGVSPATGPTFGGTNVVITGRNFTPQSLVLIGGQPAPVISITPTQIVARTPAGTAGYAHVTVTVPLVSVSLAHAFAYAPVSFTDASLIPGATVLKAIHITELRQAVNAMRSAASLAPATFTDAQPGGLPVRALHLLELRIALDQARAALGRTALAYKHSLGPGSPISTVDVRELRDGVQ